MRFSPLFIQWIYRVGFLLVVLLVLVDLLTFFYYPETIFGELFLATRERTPLTWISSLTFFFIALSCLSVYFENKKKIWYFLAFAFFFFSLDDAVYLHERISGFFVDNTIVFVGFPTYVWIIIYFPLLAFSLSALVYLLWKGAARAAKRAIVVALLFLGAAIFLDLLDGLVLKDETLVYCIDLFCHQAITHLFRLAEEALEVLALGILGYVSIQKYCLDTTKK